jgi:hypothetical protein
VGPPEGDIADKVVVCVVNLESEGGEEEEGPSFVRGEHTTTWLEAMGSKRVERAAEVRDMEAVSALEDFAVEAVHCCTNPFDFETGIIAQGGIPISNLVIRCESVVVVQHDLGRTGIGAALVLSRIVQCNLGAHGREGGLCNSVEFRR